MECLRFFSGLRSLAVGKLHLRSWDGIRHVADTLEELLVNEPTPSPISLAPLGALGSIRRLHLIGPARDVEVLAALSTLEELTLRSFRLRDLSPIVELPRLRTLELHLGGTTDLAMLPRLPSLETLELWRIRGLRDVSVVGSLHRLRQLTLQSMGGIAGLPSLRSADGLRSLRLESMTGITDLAPVADAPALEELLLIDMPHLGPESLRPLVGHPTLRHGVWGLGSVRKNAAALELLPLPPPTEP